VFNIFNVIIFSIGLILCGFLYFISTKYKISEDSRIDAYALMIPFIKSKPMIPYFLLHIAWSLFIVSRDIPYSYKIFYIIVLSIMQCLAYIDIKCFLIPNKIVLPSIVLSIILSFFTSDFKNLILGGIIAFAIIFVLAIIYPQGMGGGDVKYAFLAGIVVGKKLVVYSLLSGLIIGGLISLFLMIFKLIGRKDYLPYGPNLFIATVLFILFNI